MKFIHTSDLHLASEMTCRLSPDKAKLRRAELLMTFRRIADYAEENGVCAVLVCGDIFDEKKVRLRDRQNFSDVVRAHPGVDFLCLPGNHDENLSSLPNKPENLLTFEEEWTRYSYGDVDVYGIELSDANYNLLYATLQPLRDKTNIVLLHGQVSSYLARPSKDLIVLPNLRNKNVDYLALGHIHSYKQEALDERGVWCYSGCPEGRGYDECGEKGFVLLEVGNGRIETSFIPFSCRTIVERSVDLSGAEGEYEIESRVLAGLSDVADKGLVRICLTGAPSEHVRVDVKRLEDLLETRFFSASVKDQTKTAYDLERLKKEISLRGEFVRAVLDSQAFSSEEKDRILRCGLSALDGEEMIFS